VGVQDRHRASAALELSVVVAEGVKCLPRTLHQQAIQLSGERAPNSGTLFKVMHALGLKLSVQPATENP